LRAVTGRTPRLSKSVDRLASALPPSSAENFPRPAPPLDRAAALVAAIVTTQMPKGMTGSEAREDKVDPLVPRAEKMLLVLEAIGDDKVRVNSGSLDSPLVMLANQMLEVLALDKAAPRAPNTAFRGISQHRPLGFFQCWLRTVNEVSVCDPSRVTCHKGERVADHKQSPR
jgi:hypothetical protein